MECSHKSSNKDWLPGDNGLVRLHPYCQKCGVVKNISSDKGKKIGYFVNVINSIKDHLEKKSFKVSQAQIRLILKEFEYHGLDDDYSFTYSYQKRVFSHIVSKYIRISEDTVISFL